MSANRQLYFDKHIRRSKTPEQYLTALANSPYRTHRRMALALQEQYNQLNEMRKQDELENTNVSDDSRIEDQGDSAEG